MRHGRGAEARRADRIHVTYHSQARSNPCLTLPLVKVPSFPRCRHLPHPRQGTRHQDHDSWFWGNNMSSPVNHCPSTQPMLRVKGKVEHNLREVRRIKPSQAVVHCTASCQLTSAAPRSFLTRLFFYRLRILGWSQPNRSFPRVAFAGR